MLILLAIFVGLSHAALLPRDGACVTGQLECFGSCIDPASDNTHCGACRTWCVAEPGRPAAACVAGRCMCPSGPACGWTSGPGFFCPDLSSHIGHCGACGNACASGPCVDGTCTTCAGTFCASGSGGSCVDVLSDAAHCGACFQRCDAASGATCVDGACACPAGRTSCGFAFAQQCVDVLRDAANCGACGVRCDAACVDGACCPPGQEDCGGLRLPSSIHLVRSKYVA
ncbi:hypothetical protein CC85DRAFT_305016 [Cutaneotrichosporon oleaginosum]|uniref:TNFR-Cys domain-containing protein n=1 Tax=Cutaneotrichosporon oleaginosum TaxID=879819 RepID=A0A0J0XEI1_9TREE|nr:uncharacterized protein CC85DRAFT_305016 [Cutaneotrichosporon oleaginosum]KLT39467.1 hypothetical protein CC85DRAFT_305016 [Cutaneotrichosporon oleaginosum]TXT09974.1 hypothetical protein COLE_03908 [Cutaneotrichosporon oleaginosum]